MISYRVINILWHKHQTTAETLCRKINKQVALATVTLHTLTSHGTDIRRHLYWRWASIQINCYWKTTTRGIHKKELATGNQPNQGDGHGHEFKSRSYSMASRQIKELATGIQPSRGVGPKRHIAFWVYWWHNTGYSTNRTTNLAVTSGR